MSSQKEKEKESLKMKILNWFGLYPVFQKKQIYKNKTQKVKEIESKSNDQKDTYNKK